MEPIHNKRFKAEAEKRDLHIEYDSRIGWRITEPTENLIDFIIEQSWGDIRMGRTEGLVFRGPGGGSKNGNGGGVDGGEPKKSSTRKYICPQCKQSVRAT